MKTNMSPAEIEAWMATEEFASRCAVMNARVLAGEIMSLDGMAQELGLPWEFLAGALGAEMHAQAPHMEIVIDGSAVERH